MEKRMNKEELLELLNTLKISREEFVILSSSALMLRGIYESCGDLDIAVTEKGLEELNKNYTLIQKGNGWYTVNAKVEAILSSMEGKKEKLDKYYVQDIYDYLKFLEDSDREKDKLRIPLIKKYIKDRK